MRLALGFLACCGLASLLPYGAAQVPSAGGCPDVKVMDTFDLDAYMGVWYEHSKYPFVFEIGKKCIYARYDNQGNNTVGVLNVGVNRFTGSASNVKGYAKVLGPARLAVVFNSRQSPTEANYLVLGTDYTNYALVYSCTDVHAVVHFSVVWILTRERLPSNATVEAAKRVMDDNALTQSFLIDTLQEDDCPSADATAAETTSVAGEQQPADGVTPASANAVA